jgi:tetratricopeptide (TPR) repeat protein
MAYQSEIEKLEARFEEKPEQWFAALADAYRKSKDLDLALDILNLWLEKRPNYTSGHIVRGRVLLDRNDDGGARQAFERVLGLDAENIIALRALSEIAERAGDVTTARRWLERLLEVDPMNEEGEEALRRLGTAPAGEGMGIERASREDFEAAVPTEGLAVDESPPLGEPSKGDLPDMGVEDIERSTDDMLPDADRAAAAESGIVAEGWRDEEDSLESHAITQADIEEAEHTHEDTLTEHGYDVEMADEFAAPAGGGEDERVVGGDLPLIMPEEVSEPRDASHPVVTETMAELYVKQGHLDHALEIYRELAEARPHDSALRRRLEGLERQAGAPAGSPDDQHGSPYSVAVTGGQSAREFLRDVLSGTASPTAAEAAEDASLMHEAFGGEPEGEPTRRASDDLSLSSVFGDEPAAPPAPPAPAEGEEGRKGGFSFDQFFGGEGQGGEEPEHPPHEGEQPRRRDEGDFKDWLKGLKT